MAAKPTKAKQEELGLAALRQPVVDTGLSLDKLSAAFAEMLSGGDDPYQAPAEEPAEMDLAADLSDADDDEQAPADGCELTPRTILEAMLFVGTKGNAPRPAARWPG